VARSRDRRECTPAPLPTTIVDVGDSATRAWRSDFDGRFVTT
jgi:hypothetical protein